MNRKCVIPSVFPVALVVACTADKLAGLGVTVIELDLWAPATVCP